MKNIEERLAELAVISGKLEGSEQEQRNLIDQTAGFALEFIQKLPDLPAFHNGEPDPGIFAINDDRKSINEILSVYQQHVIENGIKAASGGHLGYIPGGGIYAAAVADFLAAATNEYAGVTYASPGAVAIENATIDWLKQLFGFPGTAVGNLTSGGSIANLVALTAARDQHGIKNERVARSVVYMSSQTHHCVHKALKIIGLEDVIIRHTALDEHGRIDVGQLKSQLSADKETGLYPFLIVATAGTTDTGVIDPLQEIGELAAAENAWYHIDAAYGGFFMLTDSKKDRLNGIQLADSLVIDPHKGLFIPYGLGAVLVQDKQAVLRSFSHTANYMQDTIAENQAISPSDISPELSRHFRGLRLWIPLQLYGIEPFRACLEEKILLTEFIRIKLVELGLNVGPEPDLTVTYFWHPTTLTDENSFNKKLLEFIHADGDVFLSSTMIGDRFVIRVSILSFRTKKETVEKCIKMIQRSIEKTTLFFLMKE